MTQQPQAPSTGRRLRISPKLILALVVLAIAIVFITQNRQTVDIHLVISTISGPLWAALTGVLVFGMLCGYLLTRRQR